MPHTSRPQRPGRSIKRAKTEPAQADPAELGTAYGMEMSIDQPSIDPDIEQVDTDEDSVGWIRRWIDRHTPR